MPQEFRLQCILPSSCACLVNLSINEPSSLSYVFTSSIALVTALSILDNVASSVFLPSTSGRFSLSYSNSATCFGLL